ncbi:MULTISPECIES: MATE family efflux transporter [unclassified Sedimentibacter]|uniref:MATE family efflux transporter n=1 Tax=unclassified Sedimentibacter TaxID=2649220 RepID=UPI0027DF73F8|nr:MATE family efflux transporter [Sedimentibacter sp. MB35-C1]WMJ77463.1 MATE family efflux transporter [Sedimentibacter sp. MB35-C1]
MQLESSNEFLGKEPIGKLLRKLAIPTITAQLINMMYNIIDRMYIGHMPNNGALALTGVGVCMPIIMIITAFAMLISSGGAPRASIMMGEGDVDEAEKVLGNSFTFQIIISIILTIVLLIWNRDILMVFGASENTIQYATAYMSVYAIGTFFVQTTLGMNAFLTAQGFAKTAMISVLIGAITNIVLDPIFIYALNMGVSGAALATIISQFLSSVWIILFLTGNNTILKIRLSNMRLKAIYILPSLALGLGSFIMSASESLLAVCFNSSLLKHGGDVAVGAMTIIVSVLQFAMLPLQGLAQGAQPISSYNFGAKNSQRVKDTFKLLLKISLGFSTIIWLMIMLFPQLFIRIFTDNSGLMSFSISAIRTYFTVMFIFGVQIACQMTFISIGNAKSSIIVAVVRKFVLLIPLIYIMPQIFKNNQVLAVYAAEPVADIIAVIFTAILFTVQFKKSLNSLVSFY